MARIPISAATDSMEYGHTALASGDLAMARRHFSDAYYSGQDNTVSRGAQMAGVVYRLLGDYVVAHDWLDSALKCVGPNDPNRGLRLAAIYRDKAEIFHDQWLYEPNADKESLRASAEAMFIESERALMLYPPPTKQHDMLEESRATNGFYGLFMAETGRWKEGVEKLRESASDLHLLGNRRYEFNNLVRLLRISLTARIFRLPRAVWLVFNVELGIEASRLEGFDKFRFDLARLFRRDRGVMTDAKRLLAALLGNRFYHWQKRRQQGH